MFTIARHSLIAALAAVLSLTTIAATVITPAAATSNASAAATSEYRA